LTINPEGKLETFTLVSDISQGLSLQLLVKSAYWKKASTLEKGEFGLLSEAVAPGFDYSDMTIAEPGVLKMQFPHLWDQVAPYIAGYNTRKQKI